MDVPTFKPQSDFAEIWHHGNVLRLAKDYCEPHGWTVAGQEQDGESPRGQLELTNGNTTQLVTYKLPEDPRLVCRKLMIAMDGPR